MYKYNSLFDLINDINSSITNGEIETEVTNKVSIPMDIILEEDGSNTIQLAVPGKTKDDIKVTSSTENGKVVLKISFIEKELTDDEKAAEAKRQYSVRKIKNINDDVQLNIPAQLDITKLTAKVAAGLLTIKIPVSDEAKPVEFEISE